MSLASMYIRMPRVRLATLDNVLATLDRGDAEIPIELDAWPGATALSRMIPFPDPVEQTT